MRNDRASKMSAFSEEVLLKKGFEELSKHFECSMAEASDAMSRLSASLESRDIASAKAALNSIARSLGWLKPARLRQSSLNLMVSLSSDSDDPWQLMIRLRTDLDELKESVLHRLIAHEGKVRITSAE